MTHNREKRSRDGESPKNIIGARLRQARRNAQPTLTQEDLAARVEAYGVHINRLSIGRIEAGKRIVLDYELRALAAALYVPMGWLAGEEEMYGGSPDDLPSYPRYKA